MASSPPPALSHWVAGCPSIMMRGVIVGETAGVERVEEAGDVESSSDDGCDVANGGNSRPLSWDGDEPADGNETDDVARAVGGT